MKIKNLSIHAFSRALTTGQLRQGILIHLIDESHRMSWGEISPLPLWSRESLSEATVQIEQWSSSLLNIEWSAHDFAHQVDQLPLFPSVAFGLESALRSLFISLPLATGPISALLMGTPEAILEQAQQRQQEGYTLAKLKVSGLPFKEAFQLICQLKDTFRLRIDVNRSWNTAEALSFFSDFPLDAFDYVEEPFKNPHDLDQFSHPLAIDESFPGDLSLEALASLPTLKALIYKPTLQGGLSHASRLYQWTQERELEFVLSSCFESEIGLRQIAALGQALGVTAPMGLGTYAFLNKEIAK